jgi:hypothetical protein
VSGWGELVDFSDCAEKTGDPAAVADGASKCPRRAGHGEGSVLCMIEINVSRQSN